MSIWRQMRSVLRMEIGAADREQRSRERPSMSPAKVGSALPLCLVSVMRLPAIPTLKSGRSGTQWKFRWVVCELTDSGFFITEPGI